MTRVLLWDFDGTLAFRPGMWRGCLVETLDEHEPGHGVEADEFIPHLRDGFPWHRAAIPHPELSDPEAWWNAVCRVLERAYAAVGLSPKRAAELAHLARARYLDVSTGWRLFDDALPTLTRLRAGGWRHVLVSNHVPELGTLVEGLGLDGLFDSVLSSAVIGYEKPHAEAFALGRRAARNADRLWMIGDNYEADVAGAEAAGIPAVLVRCPDPRAMRYAETLTGVERFLS